MADVSAEHKSKYLWEFDMPVGTGQSHVTVASFKDFLEKFSWGTDIVVGFRWGVAAEEKTRFDPDYVPSALTFDSDTLMVHCFRGRDFLVRICREDHDAVAAWLRDRLPWMKYLPIRSLNGPKDEIREAQRIL